MFTNSQGVASQKHEIRQKLIKYIINPFMFEREPNAFLESNITSAEFYTLSNEKISVHLMNTTTYVDFREPYNLTMGFHQESLRCMSWNEADHRFNNDGSCSYQMAWEVIPCLDCDIWS